MELFSLRILDFDLCIIGLMLIFHSQLLRFVFDVKSFDVCKFDTRLFGTSTPDQDDCRNDYHSKDEYKQAGEKNYYSQGRLLLLLLEHCHLFGNYDDFALFRHHYLYLFLFLLGLWFGVSRHNNFLVLDVDFTVF